MKLAQRLEEISDGDKHDDAIQDVNDTIELVEKHFDDLAIHDLSYERLIEAKDILSKVTKVYPQVMGDNPSSKRAKEFRDRAFWYLCKLEKELKEIELPQVFNDNHERHKQYESHYKRGLHT